MEESAGWLLIFVITVIVVASWCRSRGLPAPLVLTALGLVASFLPFLPHPPLSPDLILTGLLPPLLYAAAIQVSLPDFKHEWRAVLVLSVGLVIVTTLAVGAVGLWLLPVPAAVALAMGAVVGPPDAVAATAVGRRVGLPRRLVTVLESESLVNDATAIVLLHTTTAAIVGRVTARDLGLAFVLSIVGGLVVGVVVARLVGWMHAHTDEQVTSTAISLITPWIAFLPAEAVHGSGVLAVVVAGLLIAHESPVQQSATARLATRLNWSTVQFFLENSVFLLSGLQLAVVLGSLRASHLGRGTITALCVAVLLTVVLVRPVWIFAMAWLLNVPDRRGERMTKGELGVVSFAGMRGVVTLAAVFTLPPETPHREVVELVAMVVVAGTLLIQGPTLPIVARRLGAQGPDPRADALQGSAVLRRAVDAGLVELDRIQSDPDTAISEQALEDLRGRATRSVNSAWEQLRGGLDEKEMPGEAYRRTRLAIIDVERKEILRARDAGEADNEVLVRILSTLDLEESMLLRLEERMERWSAAADLVAPEGSGGGCEHLRRAKRRHPRPLSETCLECEESGDDPVHLRLCLSCGYVGCCDSSVGRHATRHFEETGHPVIRSFEDGEAWRWCYVDTCLG
ncbi:Na+/H+ antiporter [Mobilicoccus pelagius]|nr:Na+/H+ antiporter [Mobilicoccus pelagius]